MNEFARAENRGRFSLSVQVLFSIGLLFVALVSVYDPLNRGVERLFLGQSRAERAEPRSSHSVGANGSEEPLSDRQRELAETGGCVGPYGKITTPVGFDI